MNLATAREKGAHLLRRFGLGASETELDYYLQDGLNGAVDRLLAFRDVPEAVEVDPLQFPRKEDRPVPMPIVSGWWTMHMVTTRRPLQEKLTLFWHDHFAVSAEKVRGAPLMVQQNQILRENATAPFRKLLEAAVKDPAMMLWLDNQENRRGRPNENFARELLELFTLGVDRYTETDVRETARAFTGYSVVRNPSRAASFFFRPGQHDSGAKEILGQRGNLSGDDVMDMLCAMPRTAEHMVEKFWNWFVYPNPEPSVVQAYARQWMADGLDVGQLVRRIARGSEFYSPRAVRAVVKSPVDYMVSSLRQLGVGGRVTSAMRSSDSMAAQPVYLAGGVGISQTMKNMGQWLFYPPDVAGWPGGPAWISSATMVERIAWADRVFGVTSINGRGKANRRGLAPAPAEIHALLGPSPTPTSLVARLSSLFDVTLGDERRRVAITGAEKALTGGFTPQNAHQVASSVATLLFASPEFQMA